MGDEMMKVTVEVTGVNSVAVKVGHIDKINLLCLVVFVLDL